MRGALCCCLGAYFVLGACRESEFHKFRTPPVRAEPPATRLLSPLSGSQVHDTEAELDWLSSSRHSTVVLCADPACQGVLARKALIAPPIALADLLSEKAQPIGHKGDEGQQVVFWHVESETVRSPTWWFELEMSNRGETRTTSDGQQRTVAPDVNGDSYPDMVACITSSNGRDSNLIVALGSPLGLQKGSIAATLPLTIRDSTCKSAGDLNGDGYHDVVVGAPTDARDTLRRAHGAVIIFFGSASGLRDDLKLVLESQIRHTYKAGSDVQPAGDVDGDGYGDVVVASEGDIDWESSSPTRSAHPSLAILHGGARPSLRNLSALNGEARLGAALSRPGSGSVVLPLLVNNYGPKLRVSESCSVLTTDGNGTLQEWDRFPHLYCVQEVGVTWLFNDATGNSLLVAHVRSYAPPLDGQAANVSSLMAIDLQRRTSHGTHVGDIDGLATFHPTRDRSWLLSFVWRPQGTRMTAWQPTPAGKLRVVSRQLIPGFYFGDAIADFDRDGRDDLIIRKPYALMLLSLAPDEWFEERTIWSE